MPKNKKLKPYSQTNHYYLRNKVKLVHGGKEFFIRLKQLIDEARHSIHIQTYIFDDDETGTFVADALIDAAKRNIDVYLIVDGFASQNLSKDFVKKLKQAGINFHFFEPLFRSRNFYFGRRLHHKVMVIDGVRALVGSMNIADRYNDLPGRRAWYDLALYVEGEAAVALYWICCKLWVKPSKIFKLPDNIDDIIKSIPKEQYCSVLVRQNDWVNRKIQISRTYLNLARDATDRISVINSYFLPRQVFLNRLKRAAKKGIEVRIILTKVSDIKIAKLAERYLYRSMLRNKIQLYEYRPTMLHAKLAVSGNQVLTLGSYNVNGLSDFASVELNLDVKNEKFVRRVEKEIDDLIEKDCVAIDPTTYLTKPFSLKQLIQWISFQLIHLTLTVFTFYFRQKE
ncbi:MAG TPA: phospholipase D-like domain-containing protein [Chitinophagaceae bacterium]|jgi:cardiolipin synthase|nr:phospholipase D-like domain-containing protein [Chitinophagaceae bacterium]